MSGDLTEVVVRIAAQVQALQIEAELRQLRRGRKGAAAAASGFGRRAGLGMVPPTPPGPACSPLPVTDWRELGFLVRVKGA